MNETSIQKLDPADLKPKAGLLMILGTLMILVGVCAMGSPFVVGAATAIWVGAGIMVSGVFQVVQSFKTGGLKSGILGFLGGFLSIIAGIILLNRPLMSLAIFTLLLAGYFLVDGIAKIVLSFKVKPAPGWGWMLFGGVVTLLLGAMIWRQWPLSGIWAIGTLVGINVLLSGMASLTLGLAAKKA